MFFLPAELAKEARNEVFFFFYTEWDLAATNILGYQFSRSSRDTVFVSCHTVQHFFPPSRPLPVQKKCALVWQQCIKLLKSSKMSYYASLINENKSDSKVLFNTIDRMLHRTPQNHYPSCGSPKELCDKFADFFCDKIVTIRHQLDT